MNKIKVLIVDDSVLVRNILSKIVNDSQYLELVGTSADPYEAREKIKKLNPDVLTLDIEMPKMDGMTFLKNIMRLRPMPVLMISTLTEAGSDVTVKALEIGAVDYIPKPKISSDENLTHIAKEIVEKIRMAAKVNINSVSPYQEYSVKRDIYKTSPPLTGNIRLITIGASTGGVEATKKILYHLPTNMPPIVIAQHMPHGFTTSYAKRLNNLFDFNVTEFFGAKKPLVNGNVYIANGSQHLILELEGENVFARCHDGEPVNRHKPAVDVLFNSVASFTQQNTIAVLLTGMGVDGASGMAAMKQAGAITVAQDKASSVVWGMPRVAIEKQAVSHVLPLDEIGPFLIECCHG